MWATLLLGGLLIGMKHALEADHVAAVAALATRTGSISQTVRLGAVWGVGHALTLLLFGGVVLLVKSVIPEQLAQALEFGVGAMLVVLGCDVLRRAVPGRVHLHAHRHGEPEAHLHLHSHASGPLPHDPDTHRHEHGKPFPVAALLVGMMHGMAGSAALIVLSLGSVRSPALGLLYILVFGLGSIFGMAALSLAIAIPLRYSAPAMNLGQGWLKAVIGAASVVLGIVVMVRT